MKSDIGLTDDQQRVYDLLSAVRPMAVGEILEEVDFSRSKLTKILQHLVSLGLVEISGEARGRSIVDWRRRCSKAIGLRRIGLPYDSRPLSLQSQLFE